MTHVVKLPIRRRCRPLLIDASYFFRRRSGARVASVQPRRPVHERTGDRPQPDQGGVLAPAAHRRVREGAEEQAVRAAAPPAAHRALAGV